MAHEKAYFVDRFAKWTGLDGDPCCWRHYLLGIDSIFAERMLRKMDMREAMSMASADPEHLKEWLNSIYNSLGQRRRF
jgi:hypothetical protein